MKPHEIIIRVIIEAQQGKAPKEAKAPKAKRLMRSKRGKNMPHEVHRGIEALGIGETFNATAHLADFLRPGQSFRKIQTRIAGHVYTTNKKRGEQRSYTVSKATDGDVLIGRVA